MTIGLRTTYASLVSNKGFPGNAMTSVSPIRCSANLRKTSAACDRAILRVEIVAANTAVKSTTSTKDKGRLLTSAIICCEATAIKRHAFVFELLLLGLSSVEELKSADGNCDILNVCGVPFVCVDGETKLELDRLEQN